MAFTALHISPAEAQPTPVFSFGAGPSPVTVYSVASNSTVSTGNQLNVSVYVSISPPLTELDLYLWQMNMTWNPNILNFTSFMQGDEPMNNMTVGSVGVPSANGTGPFGTGLIAGGICLSRQYYVAVNSTSPLKLFTATFVGASAGTSNVSLNNVELFGISDDGNGWTPGTNPFNGIPEYTSYDEWPNPANTSSIGIFDAVQFSAAWASRLGEPGYNPACDFNEDGVVDYFDEGIIMADNGKTSSDPTWPSVTYPTGLTNTIYEFNTTVQPQVNAANTPGCWIVDSQGRPGYNFLTLQQAIASPLVTSGDYVYVRAGHSEILTGNLTITQSNLWIIGPPLNPAIETPAVLAITGTGATPLIDVNGYTINVTGISVFIWGLNITDPVATTFPAFAIFGAFCTVQNNWITGPSTPGSTGIVVWWGNNTIALNTVTGWDTCIELTGRTSFMGFASVINTIKLNNVTPYNPPSSIGILVTTNAIDNMVYWNNLFNQTELYDNSGNVNYYDDSYPAIAGFPIPPNWNKGNWISVSCPTGSPPPYTVPGGGSNQDHHALNAPISQITGDMNLDGAANILDAIQLSNSFLLNWGQHGFDPRCDLNGDGSANILDAILLSNNFLQHY